MTATASPETSYDPTRTWHGKNVGVTYAELTKDKNEKTGEPEHQAMVSLTVDFADGLIRAMRWYADADDDYYAMQGVIYTGYDQRDALAVCEEQTLAFEADGYTSQKREWLRREPDVRESYDSGAKARRSLARNEVERNLASAVDSIRRRSVGSYGNWTQAGYHAELADVHVERKARKAERIENRLRHFVTESVLRAPSV